MDEHYTNGHKLGTEKVTSLTCTNEKVEGGETGSEWCYEEKREEGQRAQSIMRQEEF